MLCGGREGLGDHLVWCCDGEVGDHVECLSNVDIGDAGDYDVDADVDGAEVCIVDVIKLL